MTRKMKNKYSELNIREHIILKNFWEYYITDRYPADSEIQEALVMGYETEVGDVYLPELKPYIMTRTNKIDTIMPAVTFDWVD